jgi:hypothetical protein
MRRSPLGPPVGVVEVIVRERPRRRAEKKPNRLLQPS